MHAEPKMRNKRREKGLQRRLKSRSVQRRNRREQLMEYKTKVFFSILKFELLIHKRWKLRLLKTKFLLSKYKPLGPINKIMYFLGSTFRITVLLNRFPKKMCHSMFLPTFLPSRLYSSSFSHLKTNAITYQVLLLSSI